MTKQEFKRRWELNDEGDDITLDDIADCYVSWGLGSTPKTKSPELVVHAVLKAASCKVADES